MRVDDVDVLVAHRAGKDAEGARTVDRGLALRIDRRVDHLHPRGARLGYHRPAGHRDEGAVSSLLQTSRKGHDVARHAAAVIQRIG